MGIFDLPTGLTLRVLWQWALMEQFAVAQVIPPLLVNRTSFFFCVAKFEHPEHLGDAILAIISSNVFLELSSFSSACRARQTNFIQIIRITVNKTIRMDIRRNINLHPLAEKKAEI